MCDPSNQTTKTYALDRQWLPYLVVKIDSNESCGFIAIIYNTEIYYNRNENQINGNSDVEETGRF
jgi:hypothetical protein